MKYLLFASCLFAALAAAPQTDSTVTAHEPVSADNIDVSLVMVVAPTRNMFGVQGGYTSAFATIDTSPNGGSLTTAPGFSAGLTYRRTLKWRLSLYTGAVYNAKNFRVSADGSTFDQHNSRLSIPLMIGYPVLFKVRNALGRTSLKLGLQADVYRISTPETEVSLQTPVITSAVNEKKGLELQASAELMYYLPQMFGRQHALSVAYFHGLNKTFTGVLDGQSKTYFTYSNAGSYVEVRYTFFVTRPFKRGW